MIIRAATGADAERLAEAYAEAFEDAWTAAEIAALMQADGATSLLAEDERGIGGFILGRAVAGEAEILAVGVAPANWRQGLGRALVEALARAAGELGAEALFLEVAEDNAAALALYAGAGFAAAGRRRAYYGRPGGDRVDAVILRRALNTTAP